MSTRKVDNLPSRKVRPISRQTVYNPSGGLNNNGSPNLISDKEWSDLLNVQFDEGGVVRKRMGFTSFADTLTSAYGLGSLVTDTYNQLLTVDGTTFKYTTGTSWTTVGSVAFTASLDTTFTQARAKTYIWNGTNGGTEWDGATLTRPGTMPKAKFSVFYSSYHIAGGVDGQSSRVYISVLADSSDFTNAATTLNNSTEVPGATVFAGSGANYIDVQPNDGDKITALGVFQDVLIIFKQFSIYQMTFDDTGTPFVQLVTRAAGCIAPRTVENVENDLYFLSREGVRVLGNEANYFNSIRTSIISQNIDPDILSMLPSSFAKANSIYYQDEYIISIPDSAGNLTYTYSYNRVFRAWSKWSNISARSMAIFVDADNNTSLLFMPTDATQVYEFTPGTYTDNGVPISCYILSKVFDFKNPDITKYFVDLGLMFRTISGEVSVEIYTEGNLLFGGTAGIAGNTVADGMGYSVLGYTMLGLGGGDADALVAYADIIRRVVINTNSTTIRFKISNDRNNENFVLLGYIHAFYPYGHYLFNSDNKIYL